MRSICLNYYWEDKMNGVDPSMLQSCGCILGAPVDGLIDDPLKEVLSLALNLV